MTAWRLPVRFSRWTVRPRPLAARQYVDSPSRNLQEFLVVLGGALVATGTAVTDTSNRLKRVAIAMGSPDATIVVMPTVIFIGVPGENGMRFEIAVPPGGEVLFDRATLVYSVAKRASRGELRAVDGIAELQQIAVQPPRFPMVVRALGHGIAAVGVGLVLLGSSPLSLSLAFLLAALVGAVKLLVRPGSYAAILLPVGAAFVIAMFAFAGAEFRIIDEPLQVLIPPLVTLLPGGILTTGIQELAAGDMMAGSSRLGYGVAQLIFLTFGIVAAITITGIPASVALLSTHRPLGDFAPWIGVLLLSVGFYLYYCGPPRSLYYLTFVLLVAYGGQLLGSLLLGNIFGSFTGAVLLTVAAYMVQSLPGAPPAVVCFLPAFWLLVPGAAGLIGLTQTAAGSQLPTSGFSVAGSVVAIALGVLAGTAVYRQIFRVAPERWGLSLV
jgi:uncharacterized membrane protein YjjP (DUF1212 family)/uncharacterized membrane protein YjjB (DUF3815 family)